MLLEIANVLWQVLRCIACREAFRGREITRGTSVGQDKEGRNKKGRERNRGGGKERKKKKSSVCLEMGLHFFPFYFFSLFYFSYVSFS